MSTKRKGAGKNKGAPPSKSAAKAMPSGENNLQIEGLSIHAGSSNVLIIAPHGPFEAQNNDKRKFRNDRRTGVIAKVIHHKTKWFTIINDAFIKPDNDKNEQPDYHANSLDPYKIKQAKMIPGYLETIKKVVDRTEGKILVVWLHGTADKSAASQQKDHIKAKKIKKADGDLHALIGYGQGKHPKIKRLQNIGKAKDQDKKSRLTARKETAEKLKAELTKRGLRTLPTRAAANDFRGRDPKRLNQWFLNEGYPLDKVES
jgi:hypothetical protein